MTPALRRQLFDRYKELNTRGLFRHWLDGLTNAAPPLVHLKLDNTRIDMFFTPDVTLDEAVAFFKAYFG